MFSIYLFSFLLLLRLLLALSVLACRVKLKFRQLDETAFNSDNLVVSIFQMRLHARAEHLASSNVQVQSQL